MLGDGEIQEGLVWEAAMSAAHYKLDNLVGILDWNGLQIDGKNENVMTVTPVDEKFKSFGWNVVVIDGHDFEQIFAAFDQARATKGQPTMIIAKTVKGKGVSFMENEAGWHGKAPNAEQIEQAVAELGGEW
jgi:transketolase